MRIYLFIPGATTPVTVGVVEYDDALVDTKGTAEILAATVRRTLERVVDQPPEPVSGVTISCEEIP